MLKASFYPRSFSIQKFATETNYFECVMLPEKKKKRRGKKNSKFCFTFSASPYPTPDCFPKSNKGNNCLLPSGQLKQRPVSNVRKTVKRWQ